MFLCFIYKGHVEEFADRPAKRRFTTVSAMTDLRRSQCASVTFALLVVRIGLVLPWHTVRNVGRPEAFNDQIVDGRRNMNVQRALKADCWQSI